MGQVTSVARTNDQEKLGTSISRGFLDGHVSPDVGEISLSSNRDPKFPIQKKMNDEWHDVPLNYASDQLEEPVLDLRTREAEVRALYVLKTEQKKAAKKSESKTCDYALCLGVSCCT